MTIELGEGIGERVAKYRRALGVSAQKLADMSGGSLSRSVVANIESGRKADVSAAELTHLGALLGVPPIALLLPVERPREQVKVGDWQATVEEVVEWFTGRELPRPEAGYSQGAARNGVGPAAILEAIRDYQRAAAEVQGAAVFAAQGVQWTGPGDAPDLTSAQEKLRAAHQRLDALGVDLMAT